LFFHWDYHEEASPKAAQNVGTIWIKVRDRSLLTPIAQQIDSTYKNSEAPTETYTEKDYKATQVAAIGNVTFLFTAISACAIVMVIALAAITLSMAARERVTEIALLKAIGFQKWRVLTMMLAEFMLLTFAGGLAGIVAAKITFAFNDIGKLTSGAVTGFAITPAIAGAGALIACAVGLIAGGFPAFRAANLGVVDGLRRVV